MAGLLECKICGGNIIPESDGITGKCESCGSVTVIPKESTNSSKLNRANYLRRANEFDKALELFEEIVEENNEDSEAYWGLVLCKYGIEYVDDTDGSKKPTCHRTVFDSILNDPDYKAALDNALGSVRYIYEDEAQKINEIQKKIKAIAANEKPYDIFICYKESDDSGQRTHDSVDAQEIYNRLTSKGYKVFFARKTLLNKLGSEYEPIIFAALNSAKIMLVYGSSPDFFNAVWVKNEWSRFRRMMKDNKDKKIIPIYDSSKMNAYDLPDELADFQAFDKYRVGFLEDLIDGLDKIMSDNTKKEKIESSQIVDFRADSSKGLLERAYMFLEDGEWDKANEYFEKVLDINPKEAKAYTGKFLVDFKLKNIDALEDTALAIENNNNYKKAFRFADEELTKDLEYFSNVQKYNRILHKLLEAEDINGFTNAKKELEKLKGFKDSNKKIEECDKRIAEINEKLNNEKYNEALKLLEEDKLNEAKEKFISLGKYKDSTHQLEICAEREKELKYNEALELKNKAVTNEEFLRAFHRFKELENYKDSPQLAEECQAGVVEYINAVKRKEKKQAYFIFGIIAVFIIGCVIFVITAPKRNYNNAVSLMEEGNYTEALAIFEKLEDYEDSSNNIEECKAKVKEQKYIKALSLFKEQKYDEAKNIFSELKDYKDSAAQIQTCVNAINEVKYQNAISLFNNGSYAEAKTEFSALGDYKDSKTRIGNIDKEEKYQNGVRLVSSGNYADAKAVFEALGDYKDSKAQVEQLTLGQDKQNYKQYYIDYIEKHRTPNYSTRDFYIMKFGLYDIDDNGIPELLTREAKPDTDYVITHIFTYSNNTLTKLYEGGDVQFFTWTGQSELFGESYGQIGSDIIDVLRYRLKNNKLTVSTIYDDVDVSVIFDVFNPALTYDPLDTYIISDY